MKVEVLVATMNRVNLAKLVSTMGVQEGVVINQVTDNHINLPKDITVGPIRMLSVRDRGLSKSRNQAVTWSTADICMLADDDVRFIKGFEQTIVDGYKQYPDADVIAFYVEDENKDLSRTKRVLERGRLGIVRSMKVRSVQISFNRKRVIGAGIKFNERFGAGTNLYMGEDNIFLADCIRRGLKVYSYPKKIATLVDEGSSWFTGFNDDYLRVKGVVFRAISPFAWPLLIVQFSIRKKKLFEAGSVRMFIIMFESALRISVE